MTSYLYDIEVFPNYLLVSFMATDSKEFTDFEYWGATETQDIKGLCSFLKTVATLIGFNNRNFDNAVAKEFLRAKTVIAAKKLADEIINSNDWDGKTYRQPTILAKTDIDVLGVLDKNASLKVYECRLGLDQVLECNEPFEQDLAREKSGKVKKYCHHDNSSTWDLWQHPVTQDKYKIKRQIAELYQQDFASRTESEIGSLVIASELKQRAQLDPSARMNSYRKPCLRFLGSEIIQPTITFTTPILQALLTEVKQHQFIYTEKAEKNKAQKFEQKINLAGLVLNFAEGGLHSLDKRAIITNLKPGEALLDFDVSSYYPNIILQEQIAPEGLETAFLAAYQEMVTKRIAAKKAGDKATASCYKIILNSIYGKFGSKASWLYNPKNMLRVTINCQLRLLQLVEMIATAGIELLQANTDGILTYPKTEAEQATVRALVKAWEQRTGFETEENRYSKILQSNVNNYVAQYAGKATYKEKGDFISQLTLVGGGSYPLIIAKAVKAWYFDQTPIATTITAAIAESKILDFCLFAKRDTWHPNIAGIQGKVNRWVWGRGVNNVLRSGNAANGRTVDDNIILANDLTVITQGQIDTERYIQVAQDWVTAIETGVTAGAVAKRRANVKKAAAKAVTTAAKAQVKANLKAAKDRAKLGLFADESGTEPTMAVPPVVYYDADFKSNRILQQLAQRHALIPEFQKNPFTDNWKQMPLVELNEIAAKHQGNFGLRLDGDVLVMDVDVEPGYELTEQQRDTIKKLIPMTTIVYRHDLEQTKALIMRGHFYFRKPAWITKHVNFCQPGTKKPIIELRTDGDAITIPPSIHPDGTVYQWHNVECLLDDSLPDFPKTLYDVLMAELPPKSPNPKSDQPVKRPKKVQEDLDEIKTQLSIDDLLNLFNIERHGDKFRCPYHAKWQLTAGKVEFESGDSAPSAKVYEDTRTFYCFACQESGDVIDLYRKITGHDFKTARADLKKIITNHQKQQAILASIPAEAPAATAKIEIDLKPLRVIKQELETLPAKTILIVSGGTGAGKSHACCEAAIAQAKAGNDVVYLCVTIKEARRRISKLKGLLDNEGLPNDWLTLITSRSSNRAEDSQDSDDASPIKSALDYSKILVTTTGYFGRKGHYAYGYQNFHKMIEGRIVICDEVQELWQKMQVFLPLQARYLLLGSDGDGGLYQRMVKCPKTGKKGDCRKCILATLRTPPQGQTSERHFYHQFAQGALPTHIKQPDLGFSAWEPLHEWYNYQLIDGTLMSKPISKDAPSYHLTENLRETAYDEFLRHLLHYLHNPHLRIEYPVVVKTQERFAPDALLSLFTEGREQKQQLQHVRFPVMACGIPTICGIDLLGPLQFFGGKVTFETKSGDAGEKEYRGAKAIIMTSATIPAGLIQVMSNLTKQNGWQMVQRKITDVPFRFDITLLKTSKSVSADKLGKLVVALDKTRDEHGFIVCARKSESDDLVEELRNFIPEKLCYFYGREFERELQSTADKKEAPKYWVTYARSAISRDEDFPEVCLVVVDCLQFLPMAALAEIQPFMTPEEKRSALLADIEKNITQIVGRVLRSQLPRVAGKVVDDPRKIVVLMHGLP